ncbi:MAG: DUF4430 domain-containing protein [Clostridiales bacterium]|nr:DUF4430 domain-containing protein [Clostridiales bacterium]
MKTNMKKWTALLLAAILLFSLSACKNADQEKKDDVTTQQDAGTTADVQNSVTVKIICDDTVTKEVWEDPVILEETEYSLEGETDAFTVLKEVAEKNKIVLVHSDGYVTGIGGLSTGDAGENSGWMFQVNGELASVGASDYMVQNGDQLVWFYTADYNTYFN